MVNRKPRCGSLPLICVILVCIFGCASLKPLEPGENIYPPGNNSRYDMVPQHYHAIGIPVSGLHGDPSRIRITFQDQFNPVVVFDSEVTPSDKGSYFLYEIEKKTLADRYKQNGVQKPPAHVTVVIKDKCDEKENFIMRWFRWWGRSDSAKYFINR